MTSALAERIFRHIPWEAAHAVTVAEIVARLGRNARPIASDGQRIEVEVCHLVQTAPAVGYETTG